MARVLWDGTSRRSTVSTAFAAEAPGLWHVTDPKSRSVQNLMEGRAPCSPGRTGASSGKAAAEEDPESHSPLPRAREATTKGQKAGGGGRAMKALSSGARSLPFILGLLVDCLPGEEKAQSGGARSCPE